MFTRKNEFTLKHLWKHIKYEMVFAALVFAFFLVFAPTAQAKPFKGIDLTSNINYEKKLGLKKPIVAYFLSTGCPCSQAHFDHLNQLQKKYPQFDFIGFNSSKEVTQEDARKFYSQYKIDFPILLDKELKYANEYKAVKTPHVFIVGANGKTLFQGGATNSRDPGRASEFYLKDALASISTNTEVKVKDSKTVGCVIKRDSAF
ncbi:MAG: redoxin domain-containing protein [Bdellovibrionaceae bacterium]|jgi:thiol-disulfide isomerase/thioredoxin|nr:redoxin domain-containing protein [Pseudobdellovibrionaceae bacterium]